MAAVGESTSLAERKRRAGRRLWIGFEGLEPDATLRELVREVQPGGFVLFGRNVHSPEQVRALTAELRALVPHAVISVDQEGGRVQRIKSPATEWPTMRDVARAEVSVESVGRALGHELATLGIHLDFAPVADVDSNPDNPVIGDRSFGRDPRQVAEHVAAFVRGMQSTGVLACAKHFPGHGDTNVDSHLDLPIVLADPATLRTRELPPFAAAVAADVATVMTAHVIFPALDAEVPATLSSRVIPRLLRGELGYDGVVVSDDLEMKAVHGRWGADEIAVRTLEATVDILLACRAPELQLELFEATVRAQEARPGLEDALRDSGERLDALLRRLSARRPPVPESRLGHVDHRRLADTVRERLS